MGTPSCLPHSRAVFFAQRKTEHEFEGDRRRGAAKRRAPTSGSIYNLGTRVETSTSAAGRLTSSLFDAQGKVLQIDAPHVILRRQGNPTDRKGRCRRPSDRRLPRSLRATRKTHHCDGAGRSGDPSRAHGTCSQGRSRDRLGTRASRWVGRRTGCRHRRDRPRSLACTRTRLLSLRARRRRGPSTVRARQAQPVLGRWVARWMLSLRLRLPRQS